MRLISTKTFALFTAVAVALTLAACGNKKSSTHEAETEGIYLNVGPLKYQVEISRQLNPGAIPEDKTFIQGIVPADAQLGEDEIWFAVFVRIENETDKPQKPTKTFTITDTDGNTYTPVTFDASNEFAYTDAPVRAHSYVPNPDSIPAQAASIGGLQLLFKLKRQSLDNRPLELHIQSFFPDDEATDTLDV
jgi:ABC-type oligopeptide transport system substrate-binding subunit